jgi:TonB family protein
VSKSMTLRFRVTAPDGTTLESRNTQDRVIVGSGEGATIQVNDPLVSKVHCLFKREKDGRLTVMDLGSERGTLIGQRSASESLEISPGEVVRIGASSVVFALESDIALPKTEPSGALAIEPGADQRRSLFAGWTSTGAAGSDQVLQVGLRWGTSTLAVWQCKVGHGLVSQGDDAAALTLVRSDGKPEHDALVDNLGKTASIRVLPHATVTLLDEAGRIHQDAELRERRRISEGAIGRIELALSESLHMQTEGVAYSFQFTKSPALVPSPKLSERDLGFVKVLLLTLMVSLALGVFINLSASMNVSASDDVLANPAQYVKLLVVPPRLIDAKKIKSLSGTAEGAKAKGNEGKFGKTDAKQAEAAPSKPGVLGDKSAADRRKVSTLMAGLFGGGAASTVFGPGGLGSGINTALGGLKNGAGSGDAQGLGGLGARGSGPGGGGTGLGLGGLGTKGLGQGAGGDGSVNLGGRGKETTRIVPGKVTVVGGLERDEIMKVIRRHESEIKFCYEQELQKQPSLSGKVSVAWTIDSAGAVPEANVSESSIGSPAVEKCMTDRIRRWKFPEPRGGGTVDVTFPWNFKPAGDSNE